MTDMLSVGATWNRNLLIKIRITVMQHWLQIHANILHAAKRNIHTYTFTLFYLCNMLFWPRDRFHSWSSTLMFYCCTVLYKWPTVWLNPHVGQHTWHVSPPPPDLPTNRSRVCVTPPLHSILGCLLIHPEYSNPAIHQLSRNTICCHLDLLRLSQLRPNIPTVRSPCGPPPTLARL